METLLVSVLITTRERRDPLKTCIHSILTQTYKNIEVLILDDCSESFKVADWLRNEISDERLKYFRSDVCLGVAGGRSFLMNKGRGEIMIVLDDDARFDNDKCIAGIIEVFRGHKNVGILAFKIINHLEQDEEEMLVPFSRRSLQKNPKLIDSKTLVSYFKGGAHAFCRDALERGGTYLEGLMYGGEELDFSYRVIQARMGILYCPNIYVHHYPQKSVITNAGKEDNEFFYAFRDKLWITYKYIPLPYLVVHFSIWVIYLYLVAIRTRKMTPYLKAIIQGINGFKKIHRVPLDREAVKYLKTHFGRLWY